jgi:hypothetical protein
MPCVYLPGPAPAVTVANITLYTGLLVNVHRAANLHGKSLTCILPKTGVPFPAAIVEAAVMHEEYVMCKTWLEFASAWWSQVTWNLPPLPPFPPCSKPPTTFVYPGKSFRILSSQEYVLF